MTILNRFGTQTLSINIADNIQSGTAGVMGDFNSRGLNVTILAENGEKLEDPEVGIKLLCKTEDGAELIFTKGEYKGGGIYSVDYPNEIFEKEQEISCIIQLTVEEEIIYSRIFKRRVAKGLLGTEREGTSTIIDLLKIMDFADSYEEKLKEMEDLGNKEEAEIISKALELTETFNANAEEKTDAFNANATEKTDAFNANAAEKTEIVDNIKEEVEGLKDITVAAKDTTLDTKKIFDGEYTDFNNRYTDIQGILEAEEDRVEAEEKRQGFDERLQKIFNEGLDSELGNYYTKPETDAELEKKSDVGHNHGGEFIHFHTLRNSFQHHKLATFTIEHSYKTFPIIITTYARRTPLNEITIAFNAELESKTLAMFTTTTDDNFYMYKVEDGKWELYARGALGSTWGSWSVVNYYMEDNGIEIDFTDDEHIENIPNGAIKAESAKNKLQEDLIQLRTDLEEESASNREEFAKINKSLDAIAVLLSNVIDITRDTNKKVDDSNRNYKALLKSDKDLIG